MTDQMLTWGDDTGVEAHTVSVDEQLPMALAHLHRDMIVGSPLALEVDRGDCDAELVARLRDLIVGAGFDGCVRFPTRSGPACACWCAA